MTKGKLPTAVFCGSMVGDFLPPQLIYQGKTSHCHPKYNFPLDWSITHTPKHWSTEATNIEYVTTIIVPYFEKLRESFGAEQAGLVI